MEEGTWYTQLREQWKPEKVRLLLVGESAPDDRGDLASRRFFYAETLTGRDALFRGVVEAVLGERHLDSRTATKTAWLNQLRDRGVFLIDLVPYPVNGSQQRGERARARRESVAGCVARAAALEPDGVIVCHKPSFDVLKGPLVGAGLPLLHDRAIPFPLGNWRADFVRDFRAAYARLE